MMCQVFRSVTEKARVNPTGLPSRPLPRSRERPLQLQQRQPRGPESHRRLGSRPAAEIRDASIARAAASCAAIFSRRSILFPGLWLPGCSTSFSHASALADL
eukprot:47802-Pyramimonas_sp.AAC.1